MRWSGNDLPILSPLPFLGLRTMLNSNRRNNNQTLREKNKKRLPSSKPKFRRKSCKANPKAEWGSPKKPSGPLTKNNQWFWQKSPKANKLSSSSNLWLETRFYSRTLTGKMRRPSSNRCQKKNLSQEIHLSKKAKQVRSFLLSKAVSSIALNWLMDRILT